jgi:TrmH family RNA methyltransferase
MNKNSENLDILTNSLVKNYKENIRYCNLKCPQIKQIKKIIKNNSLNEVAVEGVWIHQKLIDKNIKLEKFVWCPELLNTYETFLVVKEIFEKTENIIIVSKKVFLQVSDRNDCSGLLSIIDNKQFANFNYNKNKSNTIVILDGLEKLGNIGTIIRSCDGAGVDAIFICNKKASIINYKTVKGSMGAIFYVPIIEFFEIDNCIKWLNKNNFNIYLADPNTKTTYSNENYKENVALVVGNERYGISKKWYCKESRFLSIPMRGSCDSLNVGVATSIIIYDILRKR